jgi:hypothetical protein
LLTATGLGLVFDVGDGQLSRGASPRCPPYLNPFQNALEES